MSKIHTAKERILRSAPLCLLLLLVGTLLISVFYKCIIEIGVFRLINNSALHRLVYCAFELLLLGVYWRYIYKLSRKCRHRVHSLGIYYLRMGIVVVGFSAVCLFLFLYMSRDAYSWLLRITLNLCGLRFRTSFPENIRPYLIAFLIVSDLIMLLEPLISKLRHFYHHHMR